MTANNLAILLAARGHAAEARALCERAHAIFRRTLGVSHPHTRQSAANLAKLGQIRSPLPSAGEGVDAQ
jgi:hypothetical protein